jgi:GT2 family glycosyltransferase
MRLSVVIPSYSRADLLARCLRTVTAFAPPHAEILVVDDGSDGAVVTETASRFPSVRALRLSSRSGFCTAANIGIQASTGDIVEMLNDDTEVTRGWAEAALARFASPDVVAVAPLVLQLDPDRRGQPPLIDSAGDEYDPGGFARKRWHGHSWCPSPVEGEGSGVRGIKVWGASASSAFYRRSALIAAGLFPADFGAYFEDVDLSHRLQKLGNTWFEPASVVWHRVSASYGRTPSRRVLELQSRNEERVFWRNVGWRHIPRHAAVLVGKAFRRWREGTLTPWLTGRFRAWVGG